MIPSYRTINRITQLIVYARNNSVVIFLMGMDGHEHGNIHHHQHTNTQSIIIVSSYIPTSTYITINSNNRRGRKEAKSAIK
mmetsp:Transcript_26440/g.30075  ORF Transcript_26440/g.30075 Transcript_26440/m.30075 type:complete len:81 (-) Transcript_26440:48-290(-)